MQTPLTAIITTMVAAAGRNGNGRGGNKNVGCDEGGGCGSDGGLWFWH